MKAFIVVVGFMFAVTCSYACFCPEENEYCFSSYAVKAKIVKMSKPMLPKPFAITKSDTEVYNKTMEKYGYIKYEVIIDDIYRNTKFLGIVKIIEAYISDAMCGTRLDVGTWYFLHGTAWENEDKDVVLSVSVCNVEKLDDESSEPEMLQICDDETREIHQQQPVF